MTKIMIRADNEMTKADEIAMVEKLEVAFTGTNCYLESLFTPMFTGWVSEQIRNDFPPDLHDWYKSEQRDQTDAKLALDEARKEVQRLNDEIDKNEAEVNERERRWEAKIDAIIERDAAFKEAVAKDNERMYEQQQQIAELEAEVTRLKVEVYDLTHNES